MAEQIVKKHQIISVKQLVRAVQEGKSNAERFCFIIGSGASVSSGIPTGTELEYQWMKELEEACGLEGVREIAEALEDHLDNKYDKIEADWKKVKDAREAKESNAVLSSEYYFDIYKLRFFPNHRNGYHYLEKVMANKNPGFGYHPLALMLTDGTGSNLVITTNFDSLIEDALFLYTDDKPLVINHELLAEYAGDANIKRPIIAKVHRGIFFDPLNQPEETNELKGSWRDVLAPVFQNYTPIVVGYGGGDNSLMKLLEDDSVKMKNGIYWCYYEKDGWPNDKIQELVQKKNGCLVRTAGFDAAMLALGNALFPDRIGVHEAEEYLNKRTSAQIANYEEEYKRLTELEHAADGAAVQESDTDFKTEIEKMVERSTVLEKERQEQKQMTAWDYRRQGSRYCDLGQYEQAVECYSEAIKIQPKTAQFYTDRGFTYNNLKEYNKAITDLDKAIELDPKLAVAYGNRGYAYNLLGKYDKAISDFDKAIELDPKSAASYGNRGYAYNGLREFSKGISDFDKAIELDPKVAVTYNNRGHAYSCLEEYNKAKADFDKAIELDPKLAVAYSNRGHVYNKLKAYDKGITDLDRAIELDPKYAVAYSNRGYAYNELTEYDKAITDLDKAIELDPKYAVAYNNRGYAYYELEEYDRAISDFEKAIELNPKYANPYKHYGVLCKDKGDFSKALELLTKAIELNPKYKKAYEERAEVYRSLGNIVEAEKDEAMAAEL